MTKFEILQAIHEGLTDTKHKIKIVTENEKGNVLVIFTLNRHWGQTYDYLCTMDLSYKGTEFNRAIQSSKAFSIQEAFKYVETRIEENKLQLIRIRIY